MHAYDACLCATPHCAGASARLSHTTGERCRAAATLRVKHVIVEGTVFYTVSTLEV